MQVAATSSIKVSRIEKHSRSYKYDDPMPSRLSMTTIISALCSNKLFYQVESSSSIFLKTILFGMTWIVGFFLFLFFICNYWPVDYNLSLIYLLGVIAFFSIEPFILPFHNFLVD